MKFAPLLLAFLVAIVAFGCGGSGGGGSTTATTAGTTTSTSGDTLVTGIVAESSPGVAVDPTNMQVGDSVIFHLAQFDLTTSTYKTLPSAGFQTTDTNQTAGTLNGQTGAFTALASTNGKNFTISTSSLGKQYNALYGVTPVQARVTGTIIDSNGFDVEFAVVLFFNSGGTQVGQTTCQVNGTFNGSVPLTATRFNLQASSLNSSHYYIAFNYGAGSYGPLIAGCNAPLPALTSGHAAGLTAPIIVPTVSDANGNQNSPPPPPTCSP